MTAKTKMAGVTGLEPATSGVTGRHSNQLSYTPASGEALMYQPLPSHARYFSQATVFFSAQHNF